MIIIVTVTVIEIVMVIVIVIVTVIIMIIAVIVIVIVMVKVIVIVIAIVIVIVIMIAIVIVIVIVIVLLTHSLSPYHLEVALAARLIISLCPFQRAFPAVVCTQKIGTVVPQLVPIPISTPCAAGRSCTGRGSCSCAEFVFRWW